jgi:hypothetical protein
MKSLSHRFQFKNIESGSRSYSRKSAGALLLVGVLAGVTVGGGAGVIAATSTSTKTVTVCVDKEDNHMNYSKDSKCKSHQFKVVLNQKGVAGAKGDTGAAGAAGAKGDTGAAGATGAKGDTGADGAAGTNGTNGATTNSQVKNICGANGTTACAVGLQGPGGGIVFMTPSTLGNTSGLFFEAAPSTWSSQSGDPTSVWCNNSTELLGVASATGTGAMDGANKSAVMLGVCTSGAANLADAHTATVNGVVYGDWFLPSKGEMNQMYVNRDAVGGFGSGVYWTSTEKDANNAWFQDFRTGRLPDNYLKTSNTIRVRPVRAF